MQRPGQPGQAIIEKAPSSTRVFARLRKGQQWVWSNHSVGHIAAKMPRRVTIKDVKLASYAVIVSEHREPLHPNLFVDGTYTPVPGIDEKLTGEYQTYYRQMIAVPIPEPWAWAILYGHCTLINRDAPPPDGIHRKRVWLYSDGFDQRTWLEMKRQGVPRLPNESDFPFGKLIGSASVERSVNRINSQWFRGPFAWLLAGVVPIPTPIPTERKGDLWVPELYRS